MVRGKKLGSRELENQHRHFTCNYCHYYYLGFGEIMELIIRLVQWGVMVLLNLQLAVIPEL